MASWTIAAVQMDCLFAQPQANLEAMRSRLRQAARRQARLVIFPECALTGYCYSSREEALVQAQTIPGPATELLARDCHDLDVFVITGLLERGSAGELFNSCALIGPRGLVASYRKIHLPHLGVDRFGTPGDRPFAVHDLGGLRVGINICYDGTFPESARVLTLLGADLIVLPTNWPTGAISTVRLTEARALENRVYYAAVNRIGRERGFEFIGLSRILDPDAEVLAEAGPNDDTCLLAEIDPGRARAKRVVKIPGEHEVDRVGHRRPEMYAPLTGQSRSAVSAADEDAPS